MRLWRAAVLVRMFEQGEPVVCRLYGGLVRISGNAENSVITRMSISRENRHFEACCRESRVCESGEKVSIFVRCRMKKERMPEVGVRWQD